MKKHQLIPLVLFCVLFLLYTISFVKVVNDAHYGNRDQLTPPPRMDVEETVDVIEVEEPVSENAIEISAVNDTVYDEPLTRFVDTNWLNVRRDPKVLSPIVERILRNERVFLLAENDSSMAYIETLSGKKGYVASQYLSETRDEDKVEEPAAAVPDVESPNAVSSSNIYDVPIVTYHHITDNVDQYSAGMNLPDINLNAQLDYLIENDFTTITFYDLKAITAGSREMPAKPVILTFNGGYEDAYTASQHLNGKGLKGVFFVTTDKVGEEGFLDWRQIQKMRDWGMEIGSQGKTGAALANTSEYYLEQEIVVSKETLEKQLGEEIVSFAYSEGSYSQAAMDAVKAAGYAFAKSADSGSRFSNKELYRLPSLRVFYPAGATQFRVWLGQ